MRYIFKRNHVKFGFPPLCKALADEIGRRLQAVRASGCVHMVYSTGLPDWACWCLWHFKANQNLQNFNHFLKNFSVLLQFGFYWKIISFYDFLVIYFIQLFWYINILIIAIVNSEKLKRIILNCVYVEMMDTIR